MSRLGKKPITIPAGVTLSQEGAKLKVKGTKGEMEIDLIPQVTVSIENGAALLTLGNSKDSNLQGLYRSLILNAITGTTSGWTKQLELVGVGYRAVVQGANLVLSLGYSHPVPVAAPKGITFAVAENKITVAGADKRLVGEVAAGIRRLKPPEPYKGKGIKYAGEHIRKKLGKAAKAVGGAAGAK
jgi:large subunit ribosomal protein L6